MRKTGVKTISGKIIVCLLATLFMGTAAVVEAQQPAGKIPRIGFLSAQGATPDPRIDAFRQGLRELGYIEGKNINIEYRFAEGKFERFPELAEELVGLKVDVLVVSGGIVARSAQKVTATVPIVVANIGDLSGLVTSLARPGGNVTGLYQYSPELLGKRLELLKEVAPRVSRIAFLNGADGTAAKSVFEDQGKAAAKALGVQLQLVEVKAANPDIEGVFRFIVKERIDALITEATSVMNFTDKGFWS